MVQATVGTETTTHKDGVTKATSPQQEAMDKLEEKSLAQ
jgi:hypothetical protein